MIMRKETRPRRKLTFRQDRPALPSLRKNLPRDPLGQTITRKLSNCSRGEKSKKRREENLSTEESDNENEMECFETPAGQKGDDKTSSDSSDEICSYYTGTSTDILES